MTRLFRHGFTLAMCIVAVLAAARPSLAIDFYEIQIYDTDTTPVGHLTLELHSNTTTTATGQLAKSQMDAHQIHETLEATYGVLRWLEVGQYLATAKLGKEITNTRVATLLQSTVRPDKLVEWRRIWSRRWRER